MNSRNRTADKIPGTFKVLEIEIPAKDGTPEKEKIIDGLIRAAELGMTTLDSALNAIANRNIKTINAL